VGEKEVMQKMTGAREYSRIECFGVDAKGREWKAVRLQRGKAQQERGVVERRSGEPSKF